MLPWLKSADQIVIDDAKLQRTILKANHETEVQLLNLNHRRKLAEQKSQLQDLEFLLEIEIKRNEVNSSLEYVPILSGQTKSYSELWNDIEYLETAALLKNNTTLASEQINLLSLVRGEADKAGTPDELKGINACIEHIKNFMTIHAKASNKIAMMKHNKKAANEMQEAGLESR